VYRHAKKKIKVLTGVHMLPSISFNELIGLLLVVFKKPFKVNNPGRETNLTISIYIALIDSLILDC